MRRTATHYIFGLLPEEGPSEQFREIRPYERRSGDNSSRDIGEIRPVEPVRRGGAARAHTGSKGDIVASGTAARLSSNWSKWAPS